MYMSLYVSCVCVCSRPSHMIKIVVFDVDDEGEVGEKGMLGTLSYISVLFCVFFRVSHVSSVSCFVLLLHFILFALCANNNQAWGWWKVTSSCKTNP